MFYQITKNEKHTIKNKTIKICERTWNNVLFGVYRPQKVEMANKVLQEKSNYIVCWSNKLRFLKQKHNNKK